MRSKLTPEQRQNAAKFKKTQAECRASRAARAKRLAASRGEEE